MEPTPNYTRYSLDDLHDVARHIDKQRYPERYAVVVQEIEKRENEPVPVAAANAATPDGCLLRLVRFAGGMVLGGVVPCFVWEQVRMRYFLHSAVLDSLSSLLLGLFLLLGLGCGLFFAFFLQERGWVREEFSASEETPSVIPPAAFQDFLSKLLRFCGGGLLTAFATIILWLALVPQHGPHYGDGIGYGFAMLGWACILGFFGGIAAVCLPLGRQR